MSTRHLSLRISATTFARLEERRRAAGQTRSHVVAELIDEGLRLADHPGVVFRGGPAGRRPGLSGGPDLWEVAGVLRDLPATGEDAIVEVADLTGLEPAQVRVVARYYSEYRQELDDWIDRVRTEADQAEAGWRLEQGLSG